MFKKLKFQIELPFQTLIGDCYYSIKLTGICPFYRTQANQRSHGCTDFFSLGELALRRNGGKTTILLLGLSLCLLRVGAPALFLLTLPDTLYITEGENMSRLPQPPAPLAYALDAQPVRMSGDERLKGVKTGERLQLTAFDSLTLCELEIACRERPILMPGGQAVGVTIYFPGALVVGTGGFLSVEGEMVSPAQEAGIRAGDTLLAVDGTPVESAAQLAALCEGKDTAAEILLQRDGEARRVFVQPVQAAEDGCCKLGMWVRESTAGIGTLSFYDVDSLRFGALGHPVTDVDTGSLLSIDRGGISEAAVIGVSTGMQGAPGELHGSFEGFSQRIGTLTENGACGIFGELVDEPEPGLYPEGLPIAFAEEVHTGPAQILSTVDEHGVRAFSCEIIRCFSPARSGSKGMLLSITDEELLSITGGIVQGMSGSPIIQDGKLVGAVTHVLVNDPTRGYGIFIENMLEAAG